MNETLNVGQAPTESIPAAPKLTIMLGKTVEMLDQIKNLEDRINVFETKLFGPRLETPPEAKNLEVKEGEVGLVGDIIKMQEKSLHYLRLLDKYVARMENQVNG